MRRYALPLGIALCVVGLLVVLAACATPTPPPPVKETVIVRETVVVKEPAPTAAPTKPASRIVAMSFCEPRSW